ncbi:MAG: DNA topoisomerase I [Candidatus Woesearchaeota archaeon]
MVELIICEKPAQSAKIAEALADTKPIKKERNKVPYYELTHKKNKILIGCAVGHLYNLAKIKNGPYPNFNIDWKPKYEMDKKSAYIQKYAIILKELAKRADKFTVATDYDTEGSVIGHNVVKFICNQKDASRMKFSTLTKDELIESYEHKNKHLNFGMINAGETRHHLDWYYGINTSAALTNSIKAANGGYKQMSSGRVQGPTLKLIVKREEEISAFKPETYWEIFLQGILNSKPIKAKHQKDRFTKKEDITKILTKTKNKKAIVEKVTKKEVKVEPPVPFDLTTLQIEAYRTLRVSPKETSNLAQDLYTSGLISYPRTSSQKLPDSIGYDKIFKKLSKQKTYTKLCETLIGKKLKPKEGKKIDPAHPAIYPTGEASAITGKKARLYDLIVRRFLSVFGEFAVKELTHIQIDVNTEKFVLSGSRVLKPGWQTYYGVYAEHKEEDLPETKKDDEVKKPKVSSEEKETQPPKRYTEASIIRLMESKGLGTKSTRASIVDKLSEIGYIKLKPIKATELGIKIIKTLEKYVPEIIDEKLTKQLEKDMELIREHKKKEETVLDNAKKFLTKVFKTFKQHEVKIGEELLEAAKDQNVVGTCPKCKKGSLRILYSKKTRKRFCSCDRYPKCKNIYGIPQNGLVKPMEFVCKECGYPQVLVIRAGKRPWQLCLSPTCKTKDFMKNKNWKKSSKSP